MRVNNQVLELIRGDNSINKIKELTGLAKSTIYYHYKKIKGKRWPIVTIPADDKILGEFLGIFAGDGSFFHRKKTGHYRIAIHLHAIDDKDYGAYIKGLIEKNFSKKVWEYYRPPNSLSLYFNSVDISNLIKNYLNLYPKKTYDIHLNKPLDGLPKEFLTYFVRGIVDTDGHVNKYGQIVLCLASKRMIEQISLILNKFDIKNKISIREKRPPEHLQYEVKMLRRDAQDYLKIIGFSNKRKEKRLL
ncbi:hypothetical protein HYT58_01860 [Candidatus Woesearchaeota archaeon]|nr:hypothetical protein [Candidatus Woesearchaeota archaeon]